MSTTDPMATSTSSDSSSPTPTFYPDARDDLLASASNKERLALNHFNHFLKVY